MDKLREGFEKFSPKPYGVFWDEQFNRYDVNHDSDFSFADEYNVRFKCYKAGIKAAKAQSEWVSVEERLPTDEKVVLVYMYNPATPKVPAWIDTGFYRSYWRSVGHCNVTHWMPIKGPSE